MFYQEIGSMYNAFIFWGTLLIILCNPGLTKIQFAVGCAIEAIALHVPMIIYLFSRHDQWILYSVKYISLTFIFYFIIGIVWRVLFTGGRVLYHKYRR